jgi:hypothetical protein
MPQQLISTKDLAELRGITHGTLRQIYKNNRTTKPEPVCTKLHTVYFDADEMTVWLDNLQRRDIKQCLDQALAKRFLGGEFDCSIRRNRHQLKLFRARHFPPVRCERVQLKNPAGIK